MKKGFTLIEVLLAVALFAMSFAFIAPVISGLITSNDVALSKALTVQVLDRAEVAAKLGIADDQWGVYASGSSIVLYRGADYASRNSSFDEVIPLYGSTTYTTSTDITFAQHTGLPSSSATINLQAGSTLIPITINSYGTISY